MTLAPRPWSSLSGSMLPSARRQLALVCGALKSRLPRLAWAVPSGLTRGMKITCRWSSTCVEKAPPAASLRIRSRAASVPWGSLPCCWVMIITAGLPLLPRRASQIGRPSPLLPVCSRLSAPPERRARLASWSYNWALLMKPSSETCCCSLTQGPFGWAAAASEGSRPAPSSRDANVRRMGTLLVIGDMSRLHCPGDPSLTWPGRRGCVESCSAGGAFALQ